MVPVMPLAVITGILHLGTTSLQDRMHVFEKSSLFIPRYTSLLTPASDAIAGLVAATAATMTLEAVPGPTSGRLLL